MSAPLTIVTNGFSEDTDNHGIQLFIIELDRAYAAKLAEAVKAFRQIDDAVGLGEVREVVILDARGIYAQMNEDDGLEDNFSGVLGILKPGISVPAQDEQIASSHLVVTREHVEWRGRTRDGSTIDSQALPLDFLEAVAGGNHALAEQLASRRKRFDAEGHAVYYYAA